MHTNSCTPDISVHATIQPDPSELQDCPSDIPTQPTPRQSLGPPPIVTGIYTKFLVQEPVDPDAAALTVIVLDGQLVE